MKIKVGIVFCAWALCAAVAAAASPCLTITKTLQENSQDPQVISLKKFLVGEHLLTGVQSTNFFGPTTKAALIAWQKKQGLRATGMTDLTTRDALRLCAPKIPFTGTVSAGCKIVGCNGQFCVNANSVSILTSCTWNDSYACYKSATCSMKKNGQCGWADTPTLTKCLNKQTSCIKPECPKARAGCTYTGANECSCGTLTCQKKVDIGADDCVFTNLLVKNGVSVMAYKVAEAPSGSSCSQFTEKRTCTKGTLSGSYVFASCTESKKKACAFSTTSLADGSVVTAYKAASVPYGNVCVSEKRTCADGQLSGSYGFASCSVGASESCAFANQRVDSGAAVTAYKEAAVPFGQSCVSEVRTCTNGSLSGSFVNDSCTPKKVQACAFNNIPVPHGGSVLAYEKASVGAGETCRSENRTCTDGVLGGSYAYTSCSAASAPRCTLSLSSTTVQAGQSATLSWVIEAHGATGLNLSIDPGVTGGAASGSVSVSPATTTTYTGTLTYTGGQVPCESPVTLNVQRTVTLSRSDMKEVPVNGQNVYSPTVVYQGGVRYLYFGGWLTPGQTHDAIYRTQCGNLGTPCTATQMVLNPVPYGFDHVNDPTIVSMQDGNYIMYFTGLVQGLNAFTPSNNKIYYATSRATDGVNWSAPSLVIPNAWLPSATVGPTGEVEVFANETMSVGNVVRFKMGTAGTQPAPYEALVFSNGGFYLNADVKYRPSIGIYQMLGERQGSTAIDYLTSRDGVHFTLEIADIATASTTGVAYIRTPGQDSETAQWLYYAGTNDPNATQNKLFFEVWSMQ